jgi:hypothetical protein
MENGLKQIDFLEMMGDEEEPVARFVAEYVRDRRAGGQGVESIS